MKERISHVPGNKSSDEESGPLSDLSAIDSMDADSLRKLIRTTAGAFWGYALTDRKEIAEAMKLRLAHIGLTADAKDALVAIERWLDREEGRPLQSVKAEVDSKSQLVIQIVQFNTKDLPNELGKIIEN